MADNQFVREKIKEKPRNKRKILHRVLSAAVCGVVFAIAACIVMAIFMPRIMNKKQPVANPEPETNTQTQTVEETQTQEPVNVDETFYPAEELTLDSYQKLQNELYAVGTECNRSIVTIIGVSNDTDIFNNSYEEEGSGSGVILRETDTDFLILTEYRIIRKASTIRVGFINGTECEAQLVMSDGNTGLSILKVEKASLDTATINEVRVAYVSEFGLVKSGTIVIALGSPLGSTYSILTGNVTSTENEITTEDHNYTVYTTDIVGSEDGSGILVNTSGEVIGIIIQSFGTEDSMNTLTAVKVGELTKVIDKLCNGEEIPYVGAHVSTVTERIASTYGIPKGVYIKSVSMDSPAMQAGLQSGDIIIKAGGNSVNSEAAYSDVIMKKKPGDTVELVVKRKGASDYKEITYKLTVGTLAAK